MHCCCLFYVMRVQALLFTLLAPFGTRSRGFYNSVQQYTMRIYVLTVLSALLLLCIAKSEPSFHQGNTESTFIIILLCYCSTCKCFSGPIKRFQTIYPQILRKTRPTRNVSIKAWVKPVILTAVDILNLATVSGVVENLV